MVGLGKKKVDSIVSGPDISKHMTKGRVNSLVSAPPKTVQPKASEGGDNFPNRVAPGHQDIPLTKEEAEHLVEKGMKGELTSWDVSALMRQARIPDKLFELVSNRTENGITISKYRINIANGSGEDMVGSLQTLLNPMPRERSGSGGERK